MRKERKEAPMIYRDMIRRAAAIIGVPDDVWGEAVCALVVLKGGVDDIGR